MIGRGPNRQFDLIVIGAGINGAGIARDAALRGLSVFLLDKGDIGGGTSAASTRLIHGGLRYLEHAELGLVRESLSERKLLLHLAPHLVRPMPLLIPIYKSARRGFWTIRTGMLVYDALSFDKTLPRHRALSRQETLTEFPALNPHGLVHGIVYYDAQVEFAERLVVENVLSAAEHGATVATYAHVTNFIVADGEVSGVEYRDETTGEVRRVGGKIIVNAAGPWVDRVLSGLPGTKDRLIGGTKGSHIIVGPFPGATSNAIYIEAESDGRPFFIIPWNGNYLIGTTDIRFNGDPDDAQIETSEIDYLLRETNRVIPSAKLTREQILFTYSGVRPLPFVDREQPESITRRHFVRRHPELQNVFSIVGGKLTTYRSLAEEVVNQVVKTLPIRTERSGPIYQCSTDAVPLPGADIADFGQFCDGFRAQTRLLDKTIEHLLRVYGTRAQSITDIIKAENSLGAVIDEETGAVAAEIVFAFQAEFATTLGDCLMRRTMVGLNSSAGLKSIEAAARIGKVHLGWSGERAAAEIATCQQQMSRSLGV